MKFTSDWRKAAEKSRDLRTVTVPTPGLTPMIGRETVPLMATRVKRTYNLDPATVQSVREMAERYGVAGSQDAVIELAVDELERRLRDEREAVAWEEAAADPTFRAEARELEAAFRSADRETWPA